jgi:hypothetical protein
MTGAESGFPRLLARSAKSAARSPTFFKGWPARFATGYR